MNLWHFLMTWTWIQRVAYLANILGQLNQLNLKLQGKETRNIHFRDNIQAFLLKLQNWRRKVDSSNFVMFENFCTKLKNRIREL